MPLSVNSLLITAVVTAISVDFLFLQAAEGRLLLNLKLSTLSPVNGNGNGPHNQGNDAAAANESPLETVENPLGLRLSTSNNSLASGLSPNSARSPRVTVTRTPSLSLPGVFPREDSRISSASNLGSGQGTAQNTARSGLNFENDIHTHRSDYHDGQQQQVGSSDQAQHGNQAQYANQGQPFPAGMVSSSEAFASFGQSKASETPQEPMGGSGNSLEFPQGEAFHEYGGYSAGTAGGTGGYTQGKLHISQCNYNTSPTAADIGNEAAGGGNPAGSNQNQSNQNQNQIWTTSMSDVTNSLQQSVGGMVQRLKAKFENPETTRDGHGYSQIDVVPPGNTNTGNGVGAMSVAGGWYSSSGPTHANPWPGGYNAGHAHWTHGEGENFGQPPSWHGGENFGLPTGSGLNRVSQIGRNYYAQGASSQNNTSGSNTIGGSARSHYYGNSASQDGYRGSGTYTDEQTYSNEQYPEHNDVCTTNRSSRASWESIPLYSVQNSRQNSRVHSFADTTPTKNFYDATQNVLQNHGGQYARQEEFFEQMRELTRIESEGDRENSAFSVRKKSDTKSDGAKSDLTVPSNCASNKSFHSDHTDVNAMEHTPCNNRGNRGEGREAASGVNRLASISTAASSHDVNWQRGSSLGSVNSHILAAYNDQGSQKGSSRTETLATRQGGMKRMEVITSTAFSAISRLTNWENTDSNTISRPPPVRYRPTSAEGLLDGVSIDEELGASSGLGSESQSGITSARGLVGPPSSGRGDSDVYHTYTSGRENSQNSLQNDRNTDQQERVRNYRTPPEGEGDSLWNACPKLQQHHKNSCYCIGALAAVGCLFASLHDFHGGISSGNSGYLAGGLLGENNHSVKKIHGVLTPTSNGFLTDVTHIGNPDILGDGTTDLWPMNANLNLKTRLRNSSMMYPEYPEARMVGNPYSGNQLQKHNGFIFDVPYGGLSSLWSNDLSWSETAQDQDSAPPMFDHFTDNQRKIAERYSKYNPVITHYLPHGELGFEGQWEFYEKAGLGRVATTGWGNPPEVQESNPPKANNELGQALANAQVGDDVSDSSLNQEGSNQGSKGVPKGLIINSALTVSDGDFLVGREIDVVSSGEAAASLRSADSLGDALNKDAISTSNPNVDWRTVDSYFSNVLQKLPSNLHITADDARIFVPRKTMETLSKYGDVLFPNLPKKGKPAQPETQFLVKYRRMVELLSDIIEKADIVVYKETDDGGSEDSSAMEVDDDYVDTTVTDATEERRLETRKLETRNIERHLLTGGETLTGGVAGRSLTDLPTGRLLTEYPPMRYPQGYSAPTTTAVLSPTALPIQSLPNQSLSAAAAPTQAPDDQSNTGSGNSTHIKLTEEVNPIPRATIARSRRILADCASVLHSIKNGDSPNTITRFLPAVFESKIRFEVGKVQQDGIAQFESAIAEKETIISENARPKLAKYYEHGADYQGISVGNHGDDGSEVGSFWTREGKDSFRKGDSEEDLSVLTFWEAVQYGGNVEDQFDRENLITNRDVINEETTLGGTAQVNKETNGIQRNFIERRTPLPYAFEWIPTLAELTYAVEVVLRTVTEEEAAETPVSSSNASSSADALPKMAFLYPWGLYDEYYLRESQGWSFGKSDDPILLAQKTLEKAAKERNLQKSIEPTAAAGYVTNGQRGSSEPGRRILAATPTHNVVLSEDTGQTNQDDDITIDNDQWGASRAAMEIANIKREFQNAEANLNGATKGVASSNGLREDSANSDRDLSDNDRTVTSPNTWLGFLEDILPESDMAKVSGTSNSDRSTAKVLEVNTRDFKLPKSLFNGPRSSEDIQITSKVELSHICQKAALPGIAIGIANLRGLLPDSGSAVQYSDVVDNFQNTGVPNGEGGDSELAAEMNQEHGGPLEGSTPDMTSAQNIGVTVSTLGLSPQRKLQFVAYRTHLFGLIETVRAYIYLLELSHVKSDSDSGNVTGSDSDSGNAKEDLYAKEDPYSKELASQITELKTLFQIKKEAKRWTSNSTSGWNYELDPGFPVQKLDEAMTQILGTQMWAQAQSSVSGMTERTESTPSSTSPNDERTEEASLSVFTKYVKVLEKLILDLEILVSPCACRERLKWSLEKALGWTEWWQGVM